MEDSPMVAPLAVTSCAFICVGAVMGAHGVHGSLLIKSFTQNAETFTKYPIFYNEKGETLFKVKSAKVHKGAVIIAHFEEVKSRTEAETLKRVLLYIPRAFLPNLEDEEYYHTDLIGLVLQLKTGEDFGTVRAVYNFGAGDLLEVKCFSDNKLVMIPFTKEAVPQVSLLEGYMVMDADIALIHDKPEND
ncbi:MAG: 16S rRNA processing protein RimM [Alphaproteobacteria bacterium]|nr:16S rRNA processing protein RimM [Alphaproteobacteria bacterium]